MSSYGTQQQLRSAQAAYDNQSPPQAEVTEDLTMLLPLGNAQVLVCYSTEGDGIGIEGCLINGEFVEADEFSADRLESWDAAIRASWERSSWERDE